MKVRTVANNETCDLQVFENAELGKIRSVVKDGEPWFVGKDVAETLGYSNTRDALSRHVDDEDKNSVAIHDGKGNPNQTIINESGVYSLIFSSKLDKAKKFKRWVTNEVLPSIRKTGSYSLPKLDKQPKYKTRLVATTVRDIYKTADELLKGRKGMPEAMALMQSTMMVTQVYGVEIEPFLKLIPPTAPDDAPIHTATDVGKIVGMSAQAVNKFLKEKGVIEKRGERWKPLNLQYAGFMPYEAKNGHSDWTVKFTDKVFEFFNV